MKIIVDPVTRIEGHLSVSLESENGQVTAAHCSGTMFRGFELLVQGRDPFDAIQITQRICGVCPVSHSIASAQALERALDIKVPDNGRLVRNLMLGANFLQSHILHFYHLSALDFVDIAAITQYTGKDALLVSVRDWVKAEVQRNSLHPAAPFLPRYDGDYITDVDINIGAIRNYLQALRVRSLAHEAVAIFAGKMPHVASVVPGGVSCQVTYDRIEAYRARLEEIRTFIAESYLPDVIAVAKAYPQYFSSGCGPRTLLSYGAFPEGADDTHFLPAGVYQDGVVEELDISKISEDTANSWYNSTSGLHPAKGQTAISPKKESAYTWVKAPRYAGTAAEVGPLARVMVSHMSGTNPVLSGLLTGTLAELGQPLDAMFSAMGRHLARILECMVVADQCAVWLDQLVPDETAAAVLQSTPTGSGYGLVEAPRGALGHWVTIDNTKITRYQCVVPTTWNCSPRDDRDQPGPMEQALVGTPIADTDNPIEAMRVVRSFDPCLACAIH